MTAFTKSHKFNQDSDWPCPTTCSMGKKTPPISSTPDRRWSGCWQGCRKIGYMGTTVSIITATMHSRMWGRGRNCSCWRAKMLSCSSQPGLSMSKIFSFRSSTKCKIQMTTASNQMWKRSKGRQGRSEKFRRGSFLMITIGRKSNPKTGCRSSWKEKQSAWRTSGGSTRCKTRPNMFMPSMGSMAMTIPWVKVIVSWLSWSTPDLLPNC